MICQDCADETPQHTTSLCLLCRENKIEELKQEIKELESECQGGNENENGIYN